MKIKLRDYQTEAVTQTSFALSKGYKRPLIVAPTASGKSLMIAEIVVRMMKKNPLSRVLVLCHQGELLAQNEDKIKQLDASIDTGIFCAGQGRKQRTNSVILASRDSLGNDPLACGKFTVVICDEAHMIPMDAWTNKKTNYGKIFCLLKPDYVVGLTGTPWRSNKGMIYGKDKFFTFCAYDIKMQDLMEKGYLCGYGHPHKETVIDAKDIRLSSTGDYKVADLERISMPDEVIAKCLDIWQKNASDRRVSIFFACSRDHGQAIADALKADYVDPDQVAYLDGDTPKNERAQMLEDIRAGAYRCVVNIGVLTTGFDAPIIDCVCWLRATQSVSLFVQMGGRGLRLHEGKEDCLMLDMAGNFERFNSLEDPLGDEGDGKETEKKLKKCSACEHENPPRLKFCQKCKEQLPTIMGPIKLCMHCQAENHAAASKCEECYEIFITHTDIVHTKEAIKRYKVWDHIVMPNQKTKKGYPCVKVRISAGGPNVIASNTFYITLMPDHENAFVSKKGQAIVDKLKSYNPREIQTHTNNKGFKEVNIIDWNEKDYEELEGCAHEWEMSVSPMGVNHTFCPHCGEMR